MENVVELYLSFIKNYLLNTYYEYAVGGALFLILALDVIFCVSKLNKKSFLDSVGALMYFAFLLIFGEWYFNKVVFSSLEKAITVCLSIFIIQMLISAGIKLVKSSRKPKIIKESVKVVEDIQVESLNYGESIKNAVEKIKLKEEEPILFNGFIDVAYIKSLLQSLNEKNLEEKDRLEVEELEVYLLNFVNRQPNGLEKEILSKHLGGLIKKLAKYQAV